MCVFYFLSFFFFKKKYISWLRAALEPPGGLLSGLQRVSSPCDQLQFTFTTSRGDCTTMIVQSRAVIFMEVKVAEDRENPSFTVCVCVCVKPRTFCSVVSFSLRYVFFRSIHPSMQQIARVILEIRRIRPHTRSYTHTHFTHAQTEPYECNQVSGSTCQQRGEAGTREREDFGVFIISVCVSVCFFFFFCAIPE